MKSASESGVSVFFFFDPSLACGLPSTERTMQELKAHTILLGSNIESFLKAATLIDGSTVDFLFGSKRESGNGYNRSRANEVKRFIRSRSSREQEAIANFYLAVYSALIEYHQSKLTLCSCIWERKMRATFLNAAARAFAELEKNIRSDTWQDD